MALSRWQIAAIVVVAVVVIASFAVYAVLTRQSVGSVTLEGMEVTIAYAPGSSGSIGPTSNDTCANCPMTMSGGSQPWILVFGFVVPNDRTVWLNSTLSSAVPFHPDSWTGSTPPTLNTEKFVNWSVSGGQGTGFEIQLVVPYSPSASQTTFWVYLNLTANLQPTR
jgi:hypothetical protein